MPQDCKLLVVDFTLDSGQTSPLGIALADQLSDRLASQASFSVVSRSALRQFLEQERISGKSLASDEARQWLGEELGARAVVLAKTERRDESLRITAWVLSFTRGNPQNSRAENLVLSYPDLTSALTPEESFARKPKDAVSESESGVPRAGVNGVSNPVCIYCPLPSYTDPARKAKFQGSAVLDVLVLRDGSVRDAKVVQGMPFGLNRSALKNVETWKLKPAMRGDQPLDSRVTIEMTLRIF